MSTPPLSRNNSSSHLDSSDHLSGQNLSHPNEKRGVEDSTLIQSNQPKNGISKTWQVAQAGADLQERPNLSSKRSQRSLFIGEDSLPQSTLHTPPLARGVSGTPTKISTSNTLTPSSLPDALATPKSMNSSSSASRALASPKKSEKCIVHASDLPKGLSPIIDIGIQNHILKPEKLALLLVTLDNLYGKTKEAGSSNTIMRESLLITDYLSAAGTFCEKLDISKIFCEPFINHHLDHKKLDELLQKVMREFSKVGAKVTKLSEGLRPVEQINHPEIVALMVPVMKLVGDYFFGSDMKLASSKFQDPIKKLLLEIDHQVVAQFEKSGSGEMKELLQLRKSALVGFISTFSFMTIWAPKLAADVKNGAGFYAKLGSYINSYLVNKIDSFVIDILINQEHQSKKAKSYVGDYAKGLKLTTQSASKVQLVGAEKGGVLSSLKGLFSPRSSSISHSGVASKEALDEESDFNEEEARKLEMQRNRIKKLAKFAETAGFDKISLEFFVLIRNKIIDLKAKDYNAFTKNPVEYCLQQLEVFKMQKDEKSTDSDLFKKIKQSIDSYYEKSEIKKEQKRLWLNSSVMTLEDGPIVKSNDDERVVEKGVAAESSSLADDKKANADAQTDSIQVSEKTEPDSSTSVETEKSDD